MHWSSCVYIQQTKTNCKEREKRRDCLQGGRTGDITNVSKMIYRNSSASNTSGNTFTHTSINSFFLFFFKSFFKISVFFLKKKCRMIKLSKISVMVIFLITIMCLYFQKQLPAGFNILFQLDKLDDSFKEILRRFQFSVTDQIFSN